MLKGIPSILSPALLKILMEMGHGDELVIADGNFPSASVADRLVRCDGHGVPVLLDTILSLFPLDTYDEQPVCVMGVVPGDPEQPPIWEEYRAIIEKHEPGTPELAQVERFEFYERARKAFAVIATGESAMYANIIIKKGVVKP